MEIGQTKKSRPSNNKRDWSLLPDLALYSVLSQLESMAEFQSFNSVCKTWRAVSIHSPETLISQSPLILFTTGNLLHQNLFDITQNRFYKKPVLPWSFYIRYAISYSHGYIVTVNHNKSARVFLYNIFNGEEKRLPPIPKSYIWNPKYVWSEDYTRVIFSGPPSSSDTFIVAFGFDLLKPRCTYMAFSQMGKLKWTNERVGNYIQDMIFFKGGLYGIFWDGKLVAIDLSSKMDFSELGFVDHDPVDEDESKVKDWILAKTEDDLLLVSISSFSIHRWDFEAKRWAKTKSIGSRALFMGTYGFIACMESNGSSIKGNTVYYVDCRKKEWVKFSIDDDKNIDIKEWPNLTVEGPPSIWILPSMKE